MLGNTIYYYLPSPSLQKRREARAAREEEKLFLTIWDEEATDPKWSGGKGAGVARIYRAIRELKARGLPVDVPFAIILPPAFTRRLLRSDPAIIEKVRELEEALRKGKEVGKLLKEIRDLIMNLRFPPELERALEEALRLLKEEGKRSGKEDPIRIAVRSSGLAEDLPEASFAGPVSYTHLTLPTTERV